MSLGRGWKRRVEECDLIADVIGCYWVTRYSVGTIALENLAIHERLCPGPPPTDSPDFCKAQSVPTDGHIAWQYKFLQKVGLPPPLNTPSAERQALGAAMDRVRRSLNEVEIDDLYNSLAKRKGSVSASSEARSRPPPIKPSWVIQKTEETPSPGGLAIDLSEPIMEGDTDEEDERSLRKSAAYRGKVFTWVFYSTMAKAGRCYVCLRLTKARKQCSLCMQQCCTRDCIGYHDGRSPLCNPCYDKLSADTEAMSDHEFKFEYRQKEQLRDAIKQRLREQNEETKSDTGKKRPISNNKIPESEVSSESDEDMDSNQSSSNDPDDPEMPRTVEEAEPDLEVLDRAIENALQEAEKDSDGEREKEPNESTLANPRMTQEALEPHFLVASSSVGQNSMAAGGPKPFGIPFWSFSGACPTGSPKLARNTAEVRIENTVHWEHSTILDIGEEKQWKAWVRDNPTLRNWESVDSVDEATILQALASVDFPHGLIDGIFEATGKDRPLDTPGRWFHLSFSQASLDGFFSDVALYQDEGSNWKPAYHGTSLHNLPRILRSSLRRGPNAIPDRDGYCRAKIYCEREKRMNCAFMFSTHVAIPNLNPCIWMGSVLELLADRTRGDTIHGQWRQEEGSVHLTGAWIHVCDIRKAYEPDYVGSLRVCRFQYEDGMSSLLHKNPSKMNASSLALIENSTLRDAVEYVMTRTMDEEQVSDLVKAGFASLDPLPPLDSAGVKDSNEPERSPSLSWNPISVVMPPPRSTSKRGDETSPARTPKALKPKARPSSSDSADLDSAPWRKPPWKE